MINVSPNDHTQKCGSKEEEKYINLDFRYLIGKFTY